MLCPKASPGPQIRVIAAFDISRNPGVVVFWNAELVKLSPPAFVPFAKPCSHANFKTTPWSWTAVRSQEQLLKASVRLRIFLFRWHGEAVQVRDHWGRSDLLHVRLELVVVFLEGVLIWLQCPGVSFYDVDISAVFEIAHVCQRCPQQLVLVQDLAATAV